MKKLNRIGITFLMLILLLTVSGCQNTSQKASTADVPTLKWLVPGDQQADIQSVMGEANKILEPLIGAKLDLQFIDTGAYNERMTMNMASSTNFDLCFTGYVNPYLPAVQKGGYLDITEYIAKSELNNVLPDYAKKLVTVNGKIYGIPNMQIMTKCTGLFIKKDLAQEYGLNPDSIKKLDDIEPFLKWVKKTHPDLYPFMTGRYSGGVRGQDGNIDVMNSVEIKKGADGSFTYTPVYETEGYVKEVRLLRDWFVKGYIREDIASVTDSTQEFNAGKYAVWRGTYKPGAAEEYNNARKFNVICIKLTDQYIGAEAPAAMTAISKNTKYPTQSFKLLEAVNTNKALYKLISSGIEGKHYSMDDNHRVNYIANTGYGPRSDWKFGSVFNALLQPGQSDTLWQDTETFNNEAVKSPLLGFVLDNASIRTELAQIETVKSKYKAVETGAEDFNNYFDNYKREMENAGIRKVIEETKSQVDSWLLAN